MKQSWTLSLRAKFLYGLLAMMVFFGVVSVTFVQTTLHDRLSRELQKRGISIAKHFAEVSANPFLTDTMVSIEILAEDYLKKEEDLVYIFAVNNHHEVVAHTFGKKFPLQLLTVNELKPGQEYSIKPLMTEKGPILDIAAPILRGELGVVHVGLSRASIDRGVANIVGQCTWIILGMVVAGCLYIYFFTSAITRPVRELIEGVRAVGGGELGRRINVATGDEIGHLAASFNEMTASLQATTVSKDHMDQLINTMNDALVVLTPDNRIRSCNRAFRSLLDYTEGELLCQPAARFFAGQEPLAAAELRFLEANGLMSGTERTLATRDGRLVPVLTSMAPVLSDSGALQEVICAAQDMSGLKKAEQQLQLKQRELEEVNRGLEETVLRRTEELATANRELLSEVVERRRIETDLRTAKEAAEIANRAKSEFLANMSHEIRTPLNAIMGMSELLDETTMSPEQHEYLKILQRAGGNLLQLINDILDLSKVESGVMQIETIEFDLEELIDRTCEMLAMRAHEKGLELTYRIRPGTPTFLIGDPNRLRQILVNLLGNAIKFTDQGEIVLEVSNEAATRDSVALRFTVRDTGIGIPKEKISAVFDMFAQADSSTTRKYGGSGLGLAICRRFVELMGGYIRVESQVGAGSTFIFTIRVAQRALVEPTPHPPVDLTDLRILVVDDNSVNRFILRETLCRHGASVHEVDNGAAAIAELRRAREAGEQYRLMLLDCRMPEMDGFQVVEQLRRDPDLGVMGDLAIMMLTSDNRAGDLTRVLELGIGSYLVKPIKRLEMLEAVAKVLNRTGQVSCAAQAHSRQESRVENGQRILLVEDTPDNRMLIKVFLKNSGYVTEEAENGAIAVEKIREKSYDLVLMDMQMPVMDGYTATREIRMLEETEARAPVPIVALTAYAFEEDIRKSLDAGCDHHLSKPVKKVELLACIEKLTREKPQHDSAAE